MIPIWPQSHGLSLSVTIDRLSAWSRKCALVSVGNFTSGFFTSLYLSTNSAINIANVSQLLCLYPKKSLKVQWTGAAEFLKIMHQVNLSIPQFHHLYLKLMCQLISLHLVLSVEGESLAALVLWNCLASSLYLDLLPVVRWQMGSTPLYCKFYISSLADCWLRSLPEVPICMHGKDTLFICEGK